MKIRTNAGEIELTAEMVCRDMVFRLDYTQGLFTLQDEPSVEMRERLAASPHALLGCNPEIASRSDCERFGVHGDAAAHGFARLRDGGAVDLRNPGNMRKGMVLWSPEWFGDGRVTLDSVSGTGEAGTWWNVRPCGGVVPTTAHRFIGLNADHASPEDVRRMCCGAQSKEDPTAHDCHVCTLAIGDHAEHEDLATGAKWGAKPARCGACGCHGDCPWRTHAKVDPCAIQCGTCGCRWCGPRRVEASPKPVDNAKANIRARLDSAKGYFFTGSPDSIRCVLVACDLRGDVHRLAPGSYRVTLEGADAVLCDAVGRWLSDNCPMDVMYEVASASVLDRMAQADESGVLGFCAFIAGLKRWAASPEGKRAAQERALVALVNAVPEGLDPIGWRAAVLACHEFGNTAKMAIFIRDEDGEQISIERQLRENVDYTIAGEHAILAYRRAITPAAPVLRVRAAWKTRGPVLAVDDGRDE